MTVCVQVVKDASQRLIEIFGGQPCPHAKTGIAVHPRGGAGGIEG